MSAEPGGEPPLRAGPIEPAVRAEFPGLALRFFEVERGSGRSNRHLKGRLRLLSDRFGGAQAIQLRNQPIPWAYRVFFRHIGLDPDEHPTPIEARVLERMVKGGFRSTNLLDDALTIAIVESGVAIWALDADRVEGAPGIRRAAPGERLEGRASDLAAGTLLVADERRPLAVLFGETAEGRGVGKRSARMVLYSVQVKGVPDIAVEEAMWLLSEALRSP